MIYLDVIASGDLGLQIAVFASLAAMIEALNHGEVIVGMKIGEDWVSP